MGGMMKITLILPILLFSLTSFAQDKQEKVVANAKGTVAGVCDDCYPHASPVALGADTANPNYIASRSCDALNNCNNKNTESNSQKNLEGKGN